MKNLEKQKENLIKQNQIAEIQLELAEKRYKLQIELKELETESK